MSVTDVKQLKRSLKAINQQEQAASKVLVRLSLFLILASWAFEQWVSGQGTKGKAVHGGVVAGKQAIVWIGGACVYLFLPFSSSTC
jgi:hypothetical protein